MKYETPELTALTPAINAIRGGKFTGPNQDAQHNDVTGVYEDYE